MDDLYANFSGGVLWGECMFIGGHTVGLVFFIIGHSTRIDGSLLCEHYK